MAYFYPITKTTATGQTVLLVDPNTEIGKYISNEITSAGGNPNDPAALVKFIADHDTKTKAAFTGGIIAAALAVLVWWGQKKGNLPKGLEFIRNKAVFYGLLAVCAYFVWRAWDLSNKNKQVQTALAEFIRYVNAMQQQQQAQVAA